MKSTEAKDVAARVQPDMLAFTLVSRIHNDYYSQRQNQLIAQHSNAVLYPTMYAHAGAFMGTTLAAQEVKDNNPSAKMVSVEEWKGTPSFLSSTYHRRGVYENGEAGSKRIPDQTDLVANKNIKKIKKELFGTTIIADEPQERDTARSPGANNTSKPQSVYTGGICKKIEQNASPIPSDVGFTYGAPPTGSVVSSYVASASGFSHELKPDQISQDDLELKKQRRKLSNRESAKRSRQRKQLEIESLEKEDKKLRVEINQLQAKLRQVSEDCANLREQNTEIVEELVQEYGEKAQEFIGAYEPGYEELIYSKSRNIRGEEGGSDEDGSDNTENEEELEEEDLNEKTDVHPIQFHRFL